MAIRPCGHRVLIKAYKHAEVDEVKKKHSEFLSTLTVVGTETRDDASVDKGIVVAIGPTAWKNESHGYAHWCKVGDEVVFAKFSGKLVKDSDDQDYFVLNDEDIVAVTKEAVNG